MLILGNNSLDFFFYYNTCTKTRDKSLKKKAQFQNYVTETFTDHIIKYSFWITQGLLWTMAHWNMIIYEILLLSSIVSFSELQISFKEFQEETPLSKSNLIYLFCFGGEF